MRTFADPLPIDDALPRGVTVTVRLIHLRALRLRPALQRRQTAAAAGFQTGKEGRRADRPADRLALAQPRRRLAILGGNRMHWRRNRDFVNGLLTEPRRETEQARQL